MGGNCENCAKVETCKKDIGIIWGFCNTDFEPKKEERKVKVKKERVIFRRDKQHEKGADWFLAAFPDDEANPGRVACLPFYVPYKSGAPVFEPFCEVDLSYYYSTKLVHKDEMCAEACKEVIENYYAAEFEVVEKLTSGRRKRCG